LVVVPTRHDTPGFATFAAHSTCSLPSGSPDGFAFHPSRFAALPRTNTTVDPSSEIRRPVRSTPSSFMYDVTRTGVNCGAVAANTFRLPSSYEIQAMRSARLAETNSSGDAAPRNWLIVGFNPAAVGC
jgi:hypothetical protein